MLINKEVHPLSTLCGSNDQRKEEYQKVQVGKDQENVQSERDSHSKNRGGKKTN